MNTENAGRPSTELLLRTFREVMERPRNHIHVIPWQGRWSVVRDEASRASRVLASKEEALEFARARARKQALVVVVHDHNGQVESRETP